MSQPFGYKHSADTRRKIAEGLKKSYKDNPRPTGRYHHSEETLAKMAASIRRAIAEGRHPGSTAHLKKWQTAEWLSKQGGLQASVLATSFPKELRSLRRRFSCYIQRAHRSEIEWSITEDVFADLTSKACWYCGIEPLQEQKKWIGIKSNGLDRVDNSKGYIESNVVPCCVNCNRAKLTLSQSDFIALAVRIAERHGHVRSANSSPEFVLRATEGGVLEKGDHVVGSK